MGDSGMLINILKSKIHRAKITHCHLEYAGSFGIDKDIMKKAGILSYEKILVGNVNTGERFETYCIEEPAGSNKFCLYGATARLGVPGDIVIIMLFAQMTPEEAANYKPLVVDFSV